MNTYIKKFIPALLLTIGLTSCVNDLDVKPIDPNLTFEVKAEQLLNKCYSNLAFQGNFGPDGDADVKGVDGGSSPFVRQLFCSNELTTDEAICTWSDPGIPEYNFNTYGSEHRMLTAFYYRLYFGIDVCNLYLKDFADVNPTYTAEARLLRALQYYFAMDAFGNIPFTTALGDKAVQYTRPQMYEWLVKELNEIEPNLMEPASRLSSDPNYGRADKAVAWTLLMRLYLNAEVYTGKAEWAMAKEYAEKLINESGRKLHIGDAVNGWSAYQRLFMADNGENGASEESIFNILQDGILSATYGGSTFLIDACYDADVMVNPDKAGKAANITDNANWAGIRARKSLVDKFFPNDDAPNVHAYDMPTAAGDDRAIFDGIDRSKSQENLQEVGKFNRGFAVPKYSNWTSTGKPARSAKFADTDVFLFRLAEAYLTAAECDARLNGNGTTPTGTQYINALRQRAHASTKSVYKLDEILDEWSREFYFEGRRRVDLIRFGKFGGNNNYNWPWKGGLASGRNFDIRRNIFAIPLNDITTNSNLKQNPGY